MCHFNECNYSSRVLYVDDCMNIENPRGIVTFSNYSSKVLYVDDCMNIENPKGIVTFSNYSSMLMNA